MTPFYGGGGATFKLLFSGIGYGARPGSLNVTSRLSFTDTCCSDGNDKSLNPFKEILSPVAGSSDRSAHTPDNNSFTGGCFTHVSSLAFSGCAICYCYCVGFRFVHDTTCL